MARGDVVHAYSGALLSLVRNRILPFLAAWVDLDEVGAVLDKNLPDPKVQEPVGMD